MAHKFETGLFVGQPAWHGLGTVLSGAPSIAEALKLAGLDWRVIAEPGFAYEGTDANGQAVYSKIPDCQVIRRESDRKVYAHMGKSYHPLQNVDALARFQPLLDKGLATIEAAGALDEGRKVWVLAKMAQGEGEVMPGDAINRYALLAHSHDGSLRITFGSTDVRVVCWNTLSAALSGDGLIFRKHTKNAIVDIDKAVEVFAKFGADFKDQLTKYRFLASRKCDDTNLVRYAREVLKPGSADTDETVRNLDDVTANFENGTGSDLPGSRGTMWGAFNALTEYQTHQAGRSQDTRVQSGWFTDGARRTARALDLAVQFANDAPEATALARECYQNHATASADFGALLGKPVRATFDSAAE